MNADPLEEITSANQDKIFSSELNGLKPAKDWGILKDSFQFRIELQSNQLKTLNSAISLERQCP